MKNCWIALLCQRRMKQSRDSKVLTNENCMWQVSSGVKFRQGTSERVASIECDAVVERSTSIEVQETGGSVDI